MWCLRGRRSGAELRLHRVAEVARPIAIHAGFGALELQAEFVGHGEIGVADEELAEVAEAGISLPVLALAAIVELLGLRGMFSRMPTSGLALAVASVVSIFWFEVVP